MCGAEATENTYTISVLVIKSLLIAITLDGKQICKSISPSPIEIRYSATFIFNGSHVKMVMTDVGVLCVIPLWLLLCHSPVVTSVSFPCGYFCVIPLWLFLCHSPMVISVSFPCG